MTENERRHCDELMAEMDAWKPGMPLPKHSVEEHFANARLAVDDLRKDVRRFRLVFALWLLTWAALICVTLYLILR